MSLWALLAIVLLAFGRETLDDPALKAQSGHVLYVALLAVLLALGAGLLLRLAEMIFRAPAASLCATCRKRIPKGDLYCREHLREIIFEEEDRARGTQ